MSLEDRRRDLEQAFASKIPDDEADTDPPRAEPPDESWPPKPIDSGGPYLAHPREEPGFRTGAAHFSRGFERLSKRVVALLALWGTVSTMAAVALTYWVQDHLVSIDRYAKDEALHAAERAAQMRDIQALRDLANDQRVKIATLETTITMMQQQSLRSEPKRR